MKKVLKAPMNRRHQYTPLEVHEPLQKASNVEFNSEAVEKWKSVCLALFLLLLGIMFFVFSLLHAAGHFVNKPGAGWGFLVLGLLTFIPGFYHSRIAYYAWRGYSGYSLRSIPTF